MSFQATTPSLAQSFTFREPHGPGELRDLLRLRYRVFRGCNLRRFLRENAHGLDLDSYDIRAHHFGLFAVSGTDEKAIGYLRVVGDRISPQTPMVRKAAGVSPELVSVLDETPGAPYPLMAYFPDKNLVEDLVATVRRRGERLVEPSRLVLDPAYRSLRLSRHVIESAIATYFYHLGVRHAMGCCDGDKRSFYGLFGFHPLPGTTSGDFLGIGENSCLVVGSRERVPAAAAARFASMATAFAHTGEIRLIRSDRRHAVRPEQNRMAMKAIGF